MNLPIAFEEKMKELLGEEFDEYIKCYEEKRLYGLRVNTKKITVEEFRKICPFEISPIPWIENGFYYDGDKVQPAKHPYYFAGLYYLQEPSAMTPANRLPIEPGDKVLDVCAAPGGKATELGAKLNGEGVLIANDISNSRAKGLLKNIEVFGIGNVLVLSEEPGKIEEYFPEYFDKILIDAPCSGEGMFRKDKKMVKAWEEHGPEFFSKIQRSIVTQAARMLKPGGMLLYSTCTFAPEENERTIEYLKQQYPEFVVKGIRPYEGFAPGKPELTESKDVSFKKTVRIWPHKMHGEGHYLALLQKGEAQEKPAAVPKKGRAKKVPEELLKFFENITWEMDWSRLEIYSEKVYYMPEGIPNVKGIRFLRTGLYLGDMKKNRFEPSQSLAMCLKAEEYKNTVNLSVEDERIIKYLKGETIDVDDVVSAKAKGWQLILVDGYPLGWGKLANGTLKNKYLPGLEMDVVMMRLDKYLADMGIGTRTEVKKYIRHGKIQVDGTIVKTPETKIEDGQQVLFQGQSVSYEKFEYYMLYKPAGVVSATTDKKDRTVVELIASKKRKDLFPVGRLDKDTEGLLLITNDGELAHRLLTPKKHVDKVYYAKVQGKVTEEDKETFAKGVAIGNGEMAKPAVLEILRSDEISEIRLTIQEGKFHQVKRMFESVGKKVIYLKRLSMGSLSLDESLLPGEYRPLTKEELKQLC